MHYLTNELRCERASTSRNRGCHAFGRYRCTNPECGMRVCGAHVLRAPYIVSCPSCGAAARVSTARPPVLASSTA